jgi:hypothetical protein
MHHPPSTLPPHHHDTLEYLGYYDLLVASTGTEVLSLSWSIENVLNQSPLPTSPLLPNLLLRLLLRSRTYQCRQKALSTPELLFETVQRYEASAGYAFVTG